MSHAIVTASDRRCGDFLTKHWGRSLKENVDLRDIDVVVFDYGMTESQRHAAAGLGFQIRPGRRDGLVANVRIRDFRYWLETTAYDQILSIDSGDIIFQSDIRHLFETHKDTFRACCEAVPVQSYGACIDTSDFHPGAFCRVYEHIKHRPLINSGVFLGSQEKVLSVFREFCDLTKSLDSSAIDQLVVNYRCYKDGFMQLDETDNFVLLTAKSRYSVHKGQFFDGEDRLIHIVHNAGVRFRMIKDFGYGPAFNRQKNHVVAAGTAIWFALPLGIRVRLAELRRRNMARKPARKATATVAS